MPPTSNKYNKLINKWHKDRLIRKQQASFIRSELHKRGPSIFRQFGIEKVWLFGSVQDNRCSAEADIDLLVVPLDNSRFWECKRELEEELKRPVDLHSENDDPVFVKKIMERGELIYEVQS